MAGVTAKFRAAVILLFGLAGLLADLHCDSLEWLSLKIRLQENLIKMSFTGSRDYTVFSPPRTGPSGRAV
jgi:hypothetical protein